MMEPKFIEVSAIKGIDLCGHFYVAQIPYRKLNDLFTEVRSSRNLDVRLVKRLRKNLASLPTVFDFSTVNAICSTKLEFVISKGPLGSLVLPCKQQLLLVSGLELCIVAMNFSDREPADHSSLTIRIMDQVSPTTMIRYATDIHSKRSKPQRIEGNSFDPIAELTLQVVNQVVYFGENGERDKSTISNRSTKLITLSAIFEANKELLAGHSHLSFADQLEFATEFWTVVGKSLVEWNRVLAGDITASECRKQYVHSHGLMLRAIARTGGHIFQAKPKTWRRYVSRLSAIDFSRDNKDWIGTAIINDKISKSLKAIEKTAHVLNSRLND